MLVELKDALDQLWEVPQEETSGFWYFIKTRLLSVGLILALGFLLLVSLVLTAIVTALAKYAGAYGISDILIRTVNFVLSFGIVTALFAAIQNSHRLRASTERQSVFHGPRSRDSTEPVW